MKKIFFIVLLVTATVVFNSCHTTSTTAASTRTIYPLEEPIMADIDVKSEKVVGTFTGEITGVFDLDALKMNAVYDALMNGTRGDIIVAPMYEVVVEDYAKTTQVKVTVSGYPAFYKNFRPVPKVGSYEFKEMTPETPFIIITKDKENNPIDYKLVDPIFPPETGINMETLKSVKLINTTGAESKKK